MADDLFMTHPLSDLGQQALRSEESGDPPELARFNEAIASYSLNRSASWDQVLELSTKLAARRIDLKIFGYLALAAFNSERELEDGQPYLALAAALAAQSDVITQGWERCQPRIPNRRQGLLKWLAEELAEVIKARPPKPREAQDYLLCKQAADKLGLAAGTAMGLDYPLLRELREALAGHQAKVDEVLATQRAAQEAQAAKDAQAAQAAQLARKAEPAPAAAATPATVSAAQSEPAAPARAASAAPAALEVEPLPNLDELNNDALADHLATLTTRLAGHLLSTALVDPAPYWLTRALRWATHDLLRPERAAEIAASKYKTPLPVPQGHKQLSKQIPARLAQGQHAEVLGECEELFSLYPLWLDLQRWSAQALEGLGPQGSAARAVLTNQITLLLARCPEVVQFRFSDREGTPLADAETQSWLANERGRSVPSGAAPPDGEAASTEPLPEGLAAGVQHLQRQLAQATNGRQRFELRLRLAELLLRNQRSDVAVPVLDALLATAEEHRLKEWQPSLFSRLLRLSVEAARAAELDRNQRALLWSKLCQSAPDEALLLGPEPA